MKEYEICLTKEAAKDVKHLPANLKKKLHEILKNKLSHFPYSGKKLIGDLSGLFSLRLSYKDRILYSVDEKKQVIIIHRTRTHYGE